MCYPYTMIVESVALVLGFTCIFTASLGFRNGAAEPQWTDAIAHDFAYEGGTDHPQSTTQPQRK